MDFRKRDLAIIVALILMSLVGAGGLHRLFRTADSPLQTPSLPDFPPPSRSPELATAARTTFADLLKMFSAVGDEALARRFAKDFLRDPALARLWKRLEDTRHLDDFARALRDSPEFAALLRHYGSEPGFPALAERVAGTPVVAEWLPGGSMGSQRARPSVLHVVPLAAGPSAGSRVPDAFRTLPLGQVPEVGNAVDARTHEEVEAEPGQNPIDAAGTSGESGQVPPKAGSRQPESGPRRGEPSPGPKEGGKTPPPPDGLTVCAKGWEESQCLRPPCPCTKPSADQPPPGSEPKPDK